MATRDDGASGTVTFAVGQATAALPAAVAGRVGAFTISGGNTPVTLTIKQVAAAADVEALGVMLVEAGCQSQFQRLATNMLQN